MVKKNVSIKWRHKANSVHLAILIDFKFNQSELVSLIHLPTWDGTSTQFCMFIFKKK